MIAPQPSIASDSSVVPLELRNVSKTFNLGQWNEVSAVRNVSLRFGWGESVLIVGENGSGKSTLLNLIDGSIESSNGDILMQGRDVTAWPTHRRFRHLHRVHQNPENGLAPLGTVVENLAILDMKRPSLLNFGRLVRKEILGRYEQAVHAISPELATKLNRKVYLLSPGQRQAVALAMLVLRNDMPRILLADEPTAALDPGTAAVCLNVVNKKAKDGWVVLHVTHNTSIIENHRGRIITMRGGKVVGDELH